ncbi:DUF6415 family natural product biosynthesis protein [Streptomyces sp. NPDC093108]|uniref:DUF6415 family natural product biosynthesis protein n=1 Tax=Streptomyces sp. NPDC093108 TaxID=3366030 RepID=UPI0037F841EC
MSDRGRTARSGTVRSVCAARESSVGVRLVRRRLRDRAAHVLGLVRHGFRTGDGSASVSSQWDLAAARAARTVALVLDEDAPVPETPQDVADLRHWLNGHLMELSAQVPRSGAWARELEEVRQFAGQAPPADDFHAARVHLRTLAGRLDRVLGEMAARPSALPLRTVADRPGNTPAQFGAAVFWRQT